VPLVSAKRIDLAVEWEALLHGKVKGKIEMRQPELNFVDAGNPAESQTGAGGPWLQMIDDLFPFDIDSAVVHDGSIHFRAYQKKQQVDVYMNQLEASVENLTNIKNDVDPMIATVKASAMAMDQAKFQYEMKLDPFSYRPTFHLGVRLLGLDVTKVNNLARAYGAFDFERGWFDLVTEVDCKEGAVTGYVKPLFRNIKVFSLRDDVTAGNVLQVFWEALVGFATEVLKNQRRDQFGTMIPFHGNVNSPQTDILATVGNILRNAFIRAYLPKLQGVNTDHADSIIEFGPGEITDPVSIGDSS